MQNSTVRGIRFHLLILLSLLGAPALRGQTRAVVKLNPLSILVRTLNVQGEYTLNNRLSISLGFMWGGTTLRSEVAGGRLHDRWIGLTPELRFYPNFAKHPAPRGLYAGPFLRFRRVRANFLGMAYDPDLLDNLVVHVQQTLPTIGIGAVFGYQFIIKDAVAIDVFTGPYFSVGRPSNVIRCASCDGDEVPAPIGRNDFSGMELRLGAAVGLPF
jgi:hypothetical protein